MTFGLPFALNTIAVPRSVAWLPRVSKSRPAMVLVSMSRINALLCVGTALLLVPALVAQPSASRTAQIAAALLDDQYDRALDLLRTALRESPQ